jgi:histidyl-tRNA synthetase
MAEIKKIKPSLPKGTRDFLPEEVAKRNYIFDTIKSVFRKYGFQQIDTPAFERLETLTGKYGEEGDRLLFKILNSGNPFQGMSQAQLDDFKMLSFKDIHSFNDFFKESKIDDYNEPFPFTFLKKKLSTVTNILSEKGLRYDLTVPLARYVVQHQSELTFPFKRFHIAPVWRADRPQKGRYQEFYQCDADVIGSTSLLNEVELTQIYVEVFKKLGIRVQVQINNRKILKGIAEYFNAANRFEEFTTIIDKLDKVGNEAVALELNEKGISNDGGIDLSQFRDAWKSWEIIESGLQTYFKENPSVSADSYKGIQELYEVVKHFNFGESLVFNPYLARGIGYYTGIIWEVKPLDIQMGSLGGGGRYDNLTEMFGGRDMSGVGISFGIERIYDVMEELKLFPDDLSETTKVLFVHFDEVSEAYAFEQLQKVRAQDIASEIYPGKKKLDKQMNYANDKKIPYVVVVGGDEMASGKLTFKNMKSGEQQKLTIKEIIERLK